MSDKPTVEERIARAKGSSDLSVSLERRGDADTLIALGKSTNLVGRYVYQLMAEWDSCAKRRKISQEDIEHVAEAMPRIKAQKTTRTGKVRVVESLDIKGAQEKVEELMAIERRAILMRLKSLQRLMDEHSGLLPWVVAQGTPNARGVLLNVLGWWADRTCADCDGTGEVTNRRGVVRQCSRCHGSGQREVPNGSAGLAVSQEIARRVDAARGQSRQFLKELMHAKRCVSEVS